MQIVLQERHEVAVDARRESDGEEHHSYECERYDVFVPAHDLSVLEVILDKARHGGLENDAHLHSEFLHHRLQEGAVIVGHGAHRIEGIFLIVRVMRDDQAEEVAEGLGGEVHEVGVEVVVVLYELGILGAEAVREGLGVYLVQEFVVVLAERPAHLLIDIRRHVAVKVKKKKMEIIIFMF